MTSIFKVTKSVQGTGRKLLGGALVRGGQELRRAANRVTTSALGWQYRRDLFRAASLKDRLRRMTPAEFGAPAETAFIAMPGSETAADDFLSGAGIKRAPIETKKFRNGESYVRIGDTVRNKTVVIFQEFKPESLNDALISTLLAVDAAKRADAKKVVLVCADFPYIQDPPGTPSRELDFFKLALNLFFKAAHLDELRTGNINLNRHESLLFLQDAVLSRWIAPGMIARGEHLLQPKKESSSPVFLSGRHFRNSAEKIVRSLEAHHGVRGAQVNFDFTSSAVGSKINCASMPESVDLSGRAVYVFQTCNTGRVNDDLMEALLMIYAAKKRGAKEIVLVMPYLPYNRQERKGKPREPISAKLVANALVEAAGASQIITLDLHSAATQGFVDTPFQHITALHRVADFLKGLAGRMQKPIVAAPDVGRGKAARKISRLIFGEDREIAIADKDRSSEGETRTMALIGKVGNRDVILVDDMIDSGGSILSAVDAMFHRGARRVYVAAIHPVFSDVGIKLYDDHGQRIETAFSEQTAIGQFLQRNKRRVEDYVRAEANGKAFRVNALIRLQAHPHVAGIVFTDTLNVSPNLIIDAKKIHVLSVVDLIAEVCARIIGGRSLQDYQSVG